MAARFFGMGFMALAMTTLPRSVGPMVLFVAFGAAAILFAYRFCKPETLELTREGLRFSRPFRSKAFVAWTDVDRFHVQHSRYSTTIVATGRRVVASTDTFPSRWRIARTEFLVGGGWRGGDTRLVELLEEWRAFYS